MDLISLVRWRAICDAIGLRDVDDEHSKLMRAWRGWGRRYHALEHLVACLRELADARHLAQHPAEVELALWFHDAVYRTYRSNNERQSANWAGRFMERHGAAKEVTSRVHGLVLATTHTGNDLDGDQQLIADIDLAILGQPRPIYDQFERAIRREYWWVSRARYVAGRGTILRSFLARPAIYHWPHFRERYEDRARDNVQRAIAALAER